MSSGELDERPPLEGAELAAALERVPMFPLPDVVLFPQSLMPLHIFEPRYRAMTRDALAGSRLLVMGLQRGLERPGEAPQVAPIAGVGEIILAHELPDGRFNLVLRGRARVRIDQELVADGLYRVVTCSEVPDDVVETPRELMEADASLRALVHGLADSLPAGGDLLKQVVAGQETPAALADVLAATLVGEAQTRQSLLETTDVARRLEYMTREVVDLMARVVPTGQAN